jgi:ferredoxin
MKKVWVDDECIACGTCIDMCPDVFELTGDIATLKEGADLTQEDCIVEAAESCPVEAIRYER